MAIEGSTIFKAPTSHREGYYLEGWYLDHGLTDKFNFGIDTIPDDGYANITLTANWIRK